MYMCACANWKQRETLPFHILNYLNKLESRAFAVLIDGVAGAEASMKWQIKTPLTSTSKLSRNFKRFFNRSLQNVRHSTHHALQFQSLTLLFIQSVGWKLN